jgi:hypothetical protein
VKALELVSRVLSDFRKRRIAPQVERFADVVLDGSGLACGGCEGYLRHRDLLIVNG